MALQFVHVDSVRVKLGEDMIQGTGFVFQRQYKAGFMRARIYFRFFRYADKARVIVVGVLNIE